MLSAYIHGDLFSNLSHALNHVSSSSPELAGICMIETSMGTFSITVMGVKASTNPSEVIQISHPFFLFFICSGLRREFSQKHLISRMLFAARCCISGSATEQCFTWVGEEGMHGLLLLGVVTFCGLNEGNSKGNSKNIGIIFVRLSSLGRGSPAPVTTPQPIVFCTRE